MIEDVAIVRAASIAVVRVMDRAKPQPPQGLKPADFLAWVQERRSQAREIIRR
jgi:hypothetical protein